MERDMDCIRDFLLSISKEDESLIAKYGYKTRAYHAQLLIDAGYAVGNVTWLAEMSGRMSAGPYVIWRLTWDGEEFLRSVRDDEIWHRAKTDVLKTAGSWTVEVLKEWLRAELAKRIGL